MTRIQLDAVKNVFIMPRSNAARSQQGWFVGGTWQNDILYQPQMTACMSVNVSAMMDLVGHSTYRIVFTTQAYEWWFVNGVIGTDVPQIYWRNLIDGVYVPVYAIGQAVNNMLIVRSNHGVYFAMEYESYFRKMTHICMTYEFAVDGLKEFYIDGVKKGSTNRRKDQWAQTSFYWGTGPNQGPYWI
jgi:hypothetical protein